MKRILVVRAGALGDTLMATPAVRALHRSHPETEIDFLCSELAAPLLETNPHISRLYRVRRRNLPFAVSLEKRRLIRSLEARSYDLAILLESAPRYLDLLQRSHIGEIRGFAEVPFEPRQHCIVNYLKVAGTNEFKAGDLDMELRLSPNEEMAAESPLRGLALPRIGIHVGYGSRRGKKNQSRRLRGWSHDSFIQLIRMLLEGGAGIIMTGSAEDESDVKAILRQLPGGRVRSIAGRTKIRELASIIKRLDLFISTDTGPAHMAAALGIPLIVLWGPGILEQTRPMSSCSPVEIIRVSVPCAPCYGTPLMKSCTRNICMEGITPSAVFAAAQRLLARSSHRFS